VNKGKIHGKHVTCKKTNLRLMIAESLSFDFSSIGFSFDNASLVYKKKTFY